MRDQYARTRRLLGGDSMEKLARSRVAVFGVGGVGGYVCEALARSGIGAFDLIDNDTVSVTNLNRQIIALRSTVGKSKTQVMRDRMHDIDPDIDVRIRECFFLPENADDFPFDEYDYVVDAVDTVSAKIELVLRARAAGVPIISSMGTGNKLDPTRFHISDITKTSVCPLARVMRRELRKRGVEHLKVVWSDEPPVPSAPETDANVESKGTTGRAAPGSTAFTPAVAGLIIASEVIKDLTEGMRPERAEQ